MPAEPGMQLKRKKPGTDREGIRKYLYESRHSGILIQKFYDKKTPTGQQENKVTAFIVVSGISLFCS
jgi:hypothetical protein